MSLSKAEAGRLGGLAWAKTADRQTQLRIKRYNLNPSTCVRCSVPLPYEKRSQKFCGHSCRATHQNLARSTTVEWTCEGCGKVHKSLPHKAKKYCNHVCQRIVTKRETWERLQRGEISERSVIRSTLKREVGEFCFECNLTTWRGFPIPLEVHHKDGNAGNNSFDNLSLLCPNCHGITDTWKGRNKGQGRAARGLKLS